MCKEFFIEYPGHNVDAGAKVAECFWEVHHAEGDRDDGASWIASLDFVEDGCSCCCWWWCSLRPQASQGSDCLSVQYLQCVCARRSRFFTWWSRSVPAHRDKEEIKCMGPVGGKHQLNQKCICSSLTLSIVSKTKLMDNKIMSVAFKTFVRSDCST